jgi:transposase
MEEGENDLIVTWSSRREARDLKVLEERWAKSAELLGKGNSAVTASFKHGTRQFLKVKPGNSAEFSANQALYEKRKEAAGFYALVTPCNNLSSSQVYHNLRQLWRIEDCFRVMKTTLETRPVFVWGKEHIRGHFMMCYLALVTHRLAMKLVREKGLAFSGSEVIQHLREQCVSPVNLQSASHNVVYQRGGFLKQGETQENTKDANAIMSVVDIPPLLELENSESLYRKLRCRLKLRTSF